MSVASSRQVSGTDGNGQPVLSVLTKRRYRIERGRVDAGEDAPLTDEVIIANDAPELLLADSDLYAFKPTTDVVVLGSAYPPHACNEFEVSVRVGKAAKRVTVLGERHVLKGGAFTAPRSVEPIELSYAWAFGGEDAGYLQREGHPMQSIHADLDRPEILASNPFAYPRNPCGKGFTMGAPSGSDVERDDLLPRFEDPDDRLTPGRRSAGVDFLWSELPVPAGLGWFGLLWFPRCVFFGIVPDMPSPHLAREVKGGVIDLATLARGVRFVTPDSRSTCGASPGLSVPWLTGGETLVLDNLSAGSPTLELTIPRGPVRMRADGRNGKLADTQPVLSTVIVEPDEAALTLVWRGTAGALRSYSDAELEHMPFEVSW